MGRIQTSIGLITGIQITDTVDQLMALTARPRDLLVGRTDLLKSEQVAVTRLSALLLSVRFASNQLGEDSVHDERKVTSSDSSLLSATMTGTPAKGKYQFTPLATVQNQQLVSAGLKSDTDPLGGGKLTFRFGSHVERSVDLETLNGGQGVDLGTIRITDRGGSTAEIDLTTVRSVDDVLAAINGNSDVDVTAVAVGEHFRLVDNTGLAVSNLKVEEVSGGTTAASLGLDGIDVAADTADGQNLLELSADLDVDALNDRRGVYRDPVFADIRYTLRDGTEGEIDLSPLIPGGSDVDRETTLGEILDRINEAAPDKLKVQIAPDGDRLVITDLTTGSETFQLESLYDSEALNQLGLDGEAASGVITGRRLLGGLKTVLLDSLAGGQGFGELGSLELTDRSGATDTVDLSGTESLEEVLDRINAAGVDITARVNTARTGIELVDTTGATDSNLIVASGDATGSAEKLGIAVDAGVTSVTTGDMHLQTVAHNTRLDALGGGAGITKGSFRIVDTDGVADTVNLSSENIETIGDVIRAINRLDANVLAELNETGDGIRIRDLASGSGSLKITEDGSSTAADLHLLGEAVEVEIEGQSTQVIDGAMTYTVELDESDSLADLVDKINALDGGMTASTFSDGSGKPYRMTLSSDRSGKAGELVIDLTALDLGLQETVAASDAMLMLGSASSSGPKVLLSSSSNTFNEVLSGVSLQIKSTSDSPVTINVDSSSSKLVKGVSTLIANYNNFRSTLEELTEYNVDTSRGAILTGDPTALRLDSDLSRLLSGRFFGAGSIQSLAEIGIGFEQDGMLSLDESKLQSKFQSDPEALREFFADETSGFATRLGDLIDGLAGEDSSLLSQRIETLKNKIETNEARVEFMNERLDVQRERLLLDFYRMELAIGKMQTNLSAIEQFSPIPPMTTASRD